MSTSRRKGSLSDCKDWGSDYAWCDLKLGSELSYFCVIIVVVIRLVEFTYTQGHLNSGVLTMAITLYLWGLKASFVRKSIGTFLDLVNFQEMIHLLILLGQFYKVFLVSVGFNTLPHVSMEWSNKSLAAFV